MWFRTLLFTMACMLAFAPLTSASGLDKLERKRFKEPAYQTKQPRYCLLLFDRDTRNQVWLVQDGDRLYVDRHGTGDLTAPDARVALKQDGKEFRWFEDAASIKVGGLSHGELRVMQMKASREFAGNDQEWERIRRLSPELWVWTVSIAAERETDDQRRPGPLPKRIKYVANGDGRGMLVFGDTPEHAPVIHFNGPWTIGLQDMKQRLTAGSTSMLQIGIGTPGSGPGTFAFVLYPDTIPSDAYPKAQITFPPRTPDSKPIVRDYTLKERC